MKSKSRKKTASKRMIARAPRLSRRSSAFVFVACLGVWLPRSYGATLVDLDATQLPLGPLNTWTNTGTLPGNFTVPTGAIAMQGYAPTIVIAPVSDHRG